MKTLIMSMVKKFYRKFPSNYRYEVGILYHSAGSTQFNKRDLVVPSLRWARGKPHRSVSSFSANHHRHINDVTTHRPSLMEEGCQSMARCIY